MCSNHKIYLIDNLPVENYGKYATLASKGRAVGLLLPERFALKILD